MVHNIYAEVREGQPESLLVRGYVEDDEFFARLADQPNQRVETAYWLPVRQESTSGNPYATMHCRLGSVSFDLAFSFEKGDEPARRQAGMLKEGASAPSVDVEMLLDFDATGSYRARLNLSAPTPRDTGLVAAAVCAAL